MDLVFVLKWVKSVIGCMLYIFHLSGADPSGGIGLVVIVLRCFAVVVDVVTLSYS